MNMAMGASPSPPTTASMSIWKISNNPHAHRQQNILLIVCGCGWWLSLCSLLPSKLLFFTIVFASHYNFQVASSQPTPIIIATPPASLLKEQGIIHSHSSLSVKGIVAICVSAALVFVLLVMAFLKFLKFKIRRKSTPNKIVAVGTDANGNEDSDSGAAEYDVEACLQDMKLNDDKRTNFGARKFSWGDMERITMNFSKVIGSGGFSMVYLAQFPDSSLGAIKIHASSERLNQVFKQELDILLKLQHDNIVKFLGYCDDREEGALVFEYVPNGTLQDRLHNNNCIGNDEAKGWVLSWKDRLKIAFQLAQAIEYLHDKCTLQIVHGDVKTSNILLDEGFNCKLCDFGSAKMGFSSTILPPSSSSCSSVVNRIMLGSPGYVDPHYLRTGIASRKNDIYSFGVIILELITGMEAFCSTSGEMLTSIAGPQLCDATKVAEMVDPRLGGCLDMEEVKAMASISTMCLSHSPNIRPSASEISRIMKDKISSISFLVSNHKKL